jgi:hypothetical protein
MQYLLAEVLLSLTENTNSLLILEIHTDKIIKSPIELVIIFLLVLRKIEVKLN